jgi:hypothetical protein
MHNDLSTPGGIQAAQKLLLTSITLAVRLYACHMPGRGIIHVRRVVTQVPREAVLVKVPKHVSHASSRASVLAFCTGEDRGTCASKASHGADGDICT